MSRPQWPDVRDALIPPSWSYDSVRADFWPERPSAPNAVALRETLDEAMKSKSAVSGSALPEVLLNDLNTLVDKYPDASEGQSLAIAAYLRLFSELGLLPKAAPVGWFTFTKCQKIAAVLHKSLDLDEIFTADEDLWVTCLGQKAYRFLQSSRKGKRKLPEAEMGSSGGSPAGSSGLPIAPPSGDLSSPLRSKGLPSGMADLLASVPLEEDEVDGDAIPAIPSMISTIPLAKRPDVWLSLDRTSLVAWEQSMAVVYGAHMPGVTLPHNARLACENKHLIQGLRILLDMGSPLEKRVQDFFAFMLIRLEFNRQTAEADTLAAEPARKKARRVATSFYSRMLSGREQPVAWKKTMEEVEREVSQAMALEAQARGPRFAAGSSSGSGNAAVRGGRGSSRGRK